MTLITGRKICAVMGVLVVVVISSFLAFRNSRELVRPSEVIELSDGDTLDLEATIVKQHVGNRTIKRLAYNGQIPGPVIKVQKDATITVNLTNKLDVETTLHSHGLRLDNKFDGVPDVTQAPIKKGETFTYTLVFPDEGVYWYHPHIREDYTQELGLYGNFIVDGDENYWGQANQEEYVILDDFLTNGTFKKNFITHTLMGRYGDRLLINDQEDFRVDVEAGQVSRFFVTNVANTRVFDVSFEGAEMKLVGGDVGRIQREVLIDDFIIAPAERSIVEVYYPEVGEYTIAHRGKKIGVVNVVPSSKPNQKSLFGTLRANRSDYSIVTNRLGQYLAADPDKSVRLTIGMGGAMHTMMMQDMMGDGTDPDQAMRDHCKIMPNMPGCEPYLEEAAGEAGHGESGIEWDDEMAAMNAASTDQNIQWKIIDQETNKTNMDIDWNFAVGDMVKVSIFNDPNSMHPMQHPIHFHGQRFVVLAENGVANDNLQWKDTVLVPTGTTMDILIEMSNPGDWMAHCHIAEHLHAGMMFGFTVREN